MGKKYIITICRGTGKSNVGRLSVPFVYEKYQKRGSMAGPDSRQRETFAFAEYWNEYGLF